MKFEVSGKYTYIYIYIYICGLHLFNTKSLLILQDCMDIYVYNCVILHYHCITWQCICTILSDQTGHGCMLLCCCALLALDYKLNKHVIYYW